MLDTIFLYLDLRDISIGVADSFSEFQQPYINAQGIDQYKFRKCNSFAQTIYDHLWLDCNGEGRYFILLVHPNTVLTITELEIYAGRVSITFYDV